MAPITAPQLENRIRTERIQLGLFLLLLCLPWLAVANPLTTEHVTARLIADQARVVPGSRLELALVLDIQPGWHTYWRNSGDSGEAPRIDWTLPDGVTAGPIRWPHPELIRVGPFANYGYSGRAVHLIPFFVSSAWIPGTPIPIRAKAHWLVCEEHCIPESGEFELTLETSEAAAETDPAWSELFASTRAALPSGELQGAMLSEHGEVLRLSIPLTANPSLAIEDPTRLWFYSGTWGLIEHAADQPWRIGKTRLEMDLAPGALAATAVPEGVLVIGDRDGGTQSFSLTAERGPPSFPEDVNASSALTLPIALVFALVGGLILNLMPCVFPVLAIKVLSLAAGTGTSASTRAAHGFAYTAGVLLFFAILGASLLGLRAGGAAVGWGFQLQSPPFVALMADLFLVMGLSLAGVVTLGGRLMTLAGGQTGSGLLGAFGTGALAALVAAPCTAPFMGAALGYALTLAWMPSMLVMLTLGLGLALPFLLLSLIPALARRLPRPGVWMETLKQGLAFPMLGAAAWLLWVLAVQTGPQGLASALTAMLLLAFVLWVRERTLLGSPSVRLGGTLTAVLGIAISVGLGISTADPRIASPPRTTAAQDGRAELAAEPYSAQRLADARAEGRPVFVNMTAAWCITCLVNEGVALATSETARLFAEHRLLYLKGDWTKRDPEISRYLSDFGRTGVPLYVHYAPGRDPQVLPQILTNSIVRQAIVGEDQATARFESPDPARPVP